MGCIFHVVYFCVVFEFVVAARWRVSHVRMRRRGCRTQIRAWQGERAEPRPHPTPTRTHLVKDLVRHPVAHPGAERLVQQDGLELGAATAGEARGKVGQGGHLRQGVEAQGRDWGGGLGGALDQPQLAKPWGGARAFEVHGVAARMMKVKAGRTCALVSPPPLVKSQGGPIGEAQEQLRRRVHTSEQPGVERVSGGAATQPSGRRRTAA
jgi:hypothetical protein